MGKSGIINIEREAGFSGHTHNKGVLILSGYFREKYGSYVPLTLDASICFEQSYFEVDGDSGTFFFSNFIVYSKLQKKSFFNRIICINF